MERKHEVVIFDWNGTVQDDLHYIYECGVQRIFSHYGLPCPDLDTYRHQVTADFMKTFYWPNDIPRSVTAEDLNRIMAEGFKAKGAPPELFPDAPHVIRALHRRGYLVAVSSGYAQEKLDAAVKRNGLEHCFFRVDGNVRDKPESFTSIIDEAGVAAEQCAVIGDTVDDLLGATAIGAQPYICIRGFHPVERIEAEREKAPTLVVCNSLAELLPQFP